MKARVLGAALAAVTVAALSACGPAGGTGAVGAAKPAATGAGAGAGAGSGPAKTINVCAVLPVAQVAKLVGQPYTVAVDVTQQNNWTSSCAYNDADSTTEGVNVNVDTTDREPDTWNAVHTGNISEISGLGDKAFWDNDNTLYALSGPALIQVNGLDSKDRSVALARVVIAALH